MTLNNLLAGMVLLTVSGMAHSAEVKDFLYQALDSKTGTASGVVTGSMSDRFKQTTRSSAPVTADVSTLKRFRQPGCSRLALVLKQEGVPTKGGKFVPFLMRYELNVCRDGNPPIEGTDVNDVETPTQKKP